MNWEQQFIWVLRKQDVEPSAALKTMSLALLDPRIQQRSCWQWQKHSDEVTHSESLSTNKSFASAMNFIYHRGGRRWLQLQEHKWIKIQKCKDVTSSSWYWVFSSRKEISVILIVSFTDAVPTTHNVQTCNLPSALRDTFDNASFYSCTTSLVSRW